MKNKENNVDFAEQFKRRTKLYAIEIIKFCRKLSSNRETSIISNQLIRAATSVASNYRAACRARSKKAFYAKMCIVVEEADETVFWLEIIRDAQIFKGSLLQTLINEGNEILAIVATSRKTAGQNLA
ncbi:MAG TPA: four helix bundle protein [Balneolaceae bacterium]